MSILSFCYVFVCNSAVYFKKGFCVMYIAVTGSKNNKDVYRALSVIAEESDFIQSELYKNSNFIYPRNQKILYYDCTIYYFEIEEESGLKHYEKSKNLSL